jgi:myosin heavy subunit
MCRQPKPSDERFCDEIHKKHGKDKFFPQVHPKEKKTMFCIKHFAGRIKYTIGDPDLVNVKIVDTENTGNTWIAKNNDAAPDGLQSLCESSSLSELVQVFTTDVTTETKAKGGQLNKPTIAASFTKSMTDLNSLLTNTNCLFVRCIKPNKDMIPDSYSYSYVVEQLRSLGE